MARYTIRVILISIALCLAVVGSLRAAGADGAVGKQPADKPAAVDAGEKKGAQQKNAEPDELKKAQLAERDRIMKKSIRWSVLAVVPVNMFTVSALVWDWGRTTKFRFGNEGWFGRNTYAGGSDKMAHLYAHYLIMRVLYNVYDFTEDGGPLKWAFSAGITGGIALGIEIGDGFCKNQNGFSYADLTMGFLGLGIAALLEQFPAVDSFVSLSVGYIPTKYFRKHPQRLMWLTDDYSGWKFMANIKLAGFRYLGLPMPEFLKYIQFDVGYYSTGFTKYDYNWAEIERAFNRKGKERNVYIGISLNFVEVVKDFFKDTNSLACRAVQQPVKYYHIPLGIDQRFKL
jgi:hypothetical protein